MNTADLAFALKLASPCIVSSNYIAVLSHYCFEGGLAVYAYDDVSAIIVGLETKLDCALRGDTLSRLVELCGKQVELKPDGDKVLLSSGRTKVELPSLESKEFLFKFPEDDYAFEFELSAELLHGLAACVAGVSRDPLLHKEWTAVAVHIADATALYAFDGIGLLKVAVDEPTNKKARALMVPESVCKQLIDITSALGIKPADVTVKVGSEHLRVDFNREDGPEVCLIGKLLPEKIPDHAGMIGSMKLSGKPFKIPKGFHTAVAKVAVVAGGEMEPQCTVAVDGAQMTVKGSGDFGQAETVLELERDAKKASATVDPARLIRYEDRLTKMSVEADGIAMFGPGLEYYTTTKGE